LDKNIKTIETEDKYFVPFFNKIQISIERGEGIYVYDENGKRYIDLTAGWGVTCIGHANPVITEALSTQGKLIIQNPESGRTYSPARAKLLELLSGLMPHGLHRLFFSNSGAEANDAVIKLARKISGRKNVVSTDNSFHGRTISTASATGQVSHRDKYSPLMPNYIFVPYNDLDAVRRVITNDVAAVIIEPIQGEGGVNVPSDDYLIGLSRLCQENGVHLILDEVQTGFLRTGTFFCSSPYDIKVDFMTMAKGIAGGFPFAAFAMTEEMAEKIEVGDHGGTYCGNPLGCAVSSAVIRYLLDCHIEEHVGKISAITFDSLHTWQKEYPRTIVDVRGRGLLIAMEMSDKSIAARIQKECFDNGMLINVTHGTIMRIFPALNITEEEIKNSLTILKKAIDKAMNNK
jgi:acetylornithine/N-succinyldiaminopimelate aminotransferase